MTAVVAFAIAAWLYRRSYDFALLEANQQGKIIGGELSS
jgi:hypothetical protein